VEPVVTVGRIRIHAARLTAEVRRRAVPRLVRCGALVERAAKESMQGGGTAGAPSPPGTPPNVQTGVLRASIAHAATGVGTVVVGPTEWTGKVHEFGGRNHPERPFMRPALKDCVTRFPGEFRGLA